jgi:hypothetical protein
MAGPEPQHLAQKAAGPQAGQVSLFSIIKVNLNRKKGLINQ